jgi:hypothetical protein
MLVVASFLACIYAVLSLLVEWKSRRIVDTGKAVLGNVKNVVIALIMPVDNLLL